MNGLSGSDTTEILRVSLSTLPLVFRSLHQKTLNLNDASSVLTGLDSLNLLPPACKEQGQEGCQPSCVAAAPFSRCIQTVGTGHTPCQPVCQSAGRLSSCLGFPMLGQAWSGWLARFRLPQLVASIDSIKCSGKQMQILLYAHSVVWIACASQCRQVV
ncbi:hypothetical protein BD289DRAFT_284582 [Coniella lustricola]|uniref:Uncharacterized protein n=1 Tax=Coniella lustricola TaxID=2025994 RepID=A0A2T3AK66_9PEZI|nr:hypothetical protein BD289DRAFT_284582 [Coniella lustricola]